MKCLLYKMSLRAYSLEVSSTNSIGSIYFERKKHRRNILIISRRFQLEFRHVFNTLSMSSIYLRDFSVTLHHYYIKLYQKRNKPNSLIHKQIAFYLNRFARTLIQQSIKFDQRIRLYNNERKRVCSSLKNTEIPRFMVFLNEIQFQNFNFKVLSNIL